VDRGGLAGRSAAWALAVILTLICTVAGLISGRPDTVALATPFALLALAGRAGARAGAQSGAQSGAGPDARITTERRGSGGDPDQAGGARGSRLRLLLAPNPAGARVDGSRLVTTTFAALGCPPDALVLRADEDCPVLVDTPPSGETDVLSYGSASFRADLSDTRPFVPAPPVRVSILPPVGPVLPRPVSRRLVGLAGTHGSRRPGEGGELRTIAPLQPGDQLRRIDWRATARRSTDQDRLMVRRSFADAEASVFLVVDQGNDLPASTADWFAAGPPRPVMGSLHIARAAATTIAASYLAVGDRVGLDDLSGSRRALRSTGGARHLEQIRTRLAGTAVLPRRRRRRDPLPPQGAVVVVLSAFLDAEPGRLLRLWHAQGHLVAGVDCMPPLLRTESTTAQAGAVRLTLLRHQLELEDLQRDGIPVFSGISANPLQAQADSAPGTGFAASTDLDVGLRLLSRQALRRGGQAVT